MPSTLNICNNVLNNPAACRRVMLQTPLNLPWVCALTARNGFVFQLIVYALLPTCVPCLMSVRATLLLGLQRLQPRIPNYTRRIPYADQILACSEALMQGASNKSEAQTRVFA